jgi:hypothetical protein
MTQITHSRTKPQQFTISEGESDTLQRAVVARTKRYAFYWLLGEEPVLLQVRDYDGSDVTREVDPPDEMYEKLAQCDQSAG